MGLRRENSRRPLRIVGHQQQAFARLVETADGRNPGRLFSQALVDRLAPFLVGDRCDDPGGLVQDEIEFCRCRNPLAIDLDSVFVEVHRGLWISTSGTVQGHASGANQLGRAGSRAVPQLGNCTCQTDFPGTMIQGLPPGPAPRSPGLRSEVPANQAIAPLRLRECRPQIKGSTGYRAP